MQKVPKTFACFYSIYFIAFYMCGRLNTAAASDDRCDTVISWQTCW